MKVKTLRFGEVDVPEEHVLTLPEGMIGFPQFRTYAIIDNPHWAPFQWMQSVEEVVLSFVIVEAKKIFPDYAPEAPGFDTVYVVITLEDPLTESTANLKGPIVVNRSTRTGRQLVLEDPRYPTKQKIFI